VPPNSDMLPHFWDIESSLDNDTFDAQLTLPYNLEEIQALGYTEGDIVGAYYDPELHAWSYFPATFDSTAQTATFNVSHFSRYALALKKPEDIIEPETPETATTTQSSGYRTGTRIKRPEAQVLGVSTSNISVDELGKLVQAIEELIGVYSEMTIKQKQAVVSLLDNILLILDSQKL